MRQPLSTAALVLFVACCLTGCDQIKQTLGLSEKKAPPPSGKSATAAPADQGESKGGVVLMVLPLLGYQSVEYGVTRKTLEEAGFTIQVGAARLGEATDAAGDEKTAIDITLEDAIDKLDDYVAVVFIGGPGAQMYHKDETAHNLVQATVAKDKPLGAICLASFTLAHAGVLMGRRATAWLGGRFKKADFEALGPKFSDHPVVNDGKIVTANGPDAAGEFAQTLVKLLK